MDAADTKTSNCEVCQLPVNANKNLYLKHLWVHHSKVKTLCTFCNAKFKGLTQLNEHMLVEHEAHSCKVCGITFFLEDENTTREAIANGTVKISDGKPSESQASKLVAELSENKLYKQHQEKCPGKYVMRCQMPECYSQEEMGIKDLIKHLVKGHKLGDDCDGLLTAADVSYQLAYKGSRTKPYRRWEISDSETEKSLWADMQRLQVFSFMKYNEYSCVTAPRKTFHDEDFEQKGTKDSERRRESEHKPHKSKKTDGNRESNDGEGAKGKSGAKYMPVTPALLKDPLEETEAIKIRMNQELQLFYTERATAPDPMVKTVSGTSDFEDIRQLHFQINRNNYRRFGDNISNCYSNAPHQLLKISPEEEKELYQNMNSNENKDAKLADFVEQKFNKKISTSKVSASQESLISQLLPKQAMYPNHYQNEHPNQKKNKQPSPYPNSTSGQPNLPRMSKCLQFPETVDLGYRYLRCFECKEILSFTTIETYLEHVYTHESSKDCQACILCDRSFLHPEAFKLHLTTIHSYT